MPKAGCLADYSDDLKAGSMVARSAVRLVACSVASKAAHWVESWAVPTDVP